MPVAAARIKRLPHYKDTLRNSVVSGELMSWRVASPPNIGSTTRTDSVAQKKYHACYLFCAVFFPKRICCRSRRLHDCAERRAGFGCNSGTFPQPFPLAWWQDVPSRRPANFAQRKIAGHGGDAPDYERDLIFGAGAGGLAPQDALSHPWGAKPPRSRWVATDIAVAFSRIRRGSEQMVRAGHGRAMRARDREPDVGSHSRGNRWIAFAYARPG